MRAMACFRRPVLVATSITLAIAIELADRAGTQAPSHSDNSGDDGPINTGRPESVNNGSTSKSETGCNRCSMVPTKTDSGPDAGRVRVAALSDGSAITLYHSVQAGSFRVLWTLHELDVRGFRLVTMPWPTRLFVKEYKRLNVLGRIPYFVDRGTQMTDSCRIPMYLVERFGPSPLQVQPYEDDFGAYSDWIKYAEVALTVPQREFVRFASQEPNKGLGEAVAAYAKWFVARLEVLEQALEDGREFLCEQRFTIADVCVTYVLLLGTTIELKKTYGPYAPRTAAYLGRMRARPAFVAAVEAERASAQAWASGAQRL